jgi:LacI family transcriptional regulator
VSFISTIAKEAGVSTATVSLVANNKGKISQATRHRVQSLLDRYQFQPRSSRTGKSKAPAYAQSTAAKLGTICVVCPQITSDDDAPAGVYRYWSQALQEQILKKGGNFSFVTGDLLAKNNPIFEHGLEDGLFNGIILMGVEDEDGYMNAALRSRVPLVILNRRSLHGEFSTVGQDNFGGGRLIAKHLIELGHQHIGMIAPSSQSKISHYIQARQAGFEFELKTHDLKPSFMLELAPKEHDKTIKALAPKVRKSKATAVFLSTDLQAIQFIEQWEAMGLSVPDDLSVAGFDHADVQTAGGLKLTTIAHDSRVVAQRAVSMLEDLINGQSESMSEVVQVSLVTGDTTRRID